MAWLRADRYPDFVVPVSQTFPLGPVHQCRQVFAQCACSSPYLCSYWVTVINTTSCNIWGFHKIGINQACSHSLRVGDRSSSDPRAMSLRLPGRMAMRAKGAQPSGRRPPSPGYPTIFRAPPASCSTWTVCGIYSPEYSYSMLIHKLQVK
jgi:hypothetical protein